MHANSQLLFEAYATRFVRPQSRVLEIGPDSIPSSYAKVFREMPVTWHTLDISNGADLTYPGVSDYEFPIPEEAYDVIIAGQVIEHVRKIWLWIQEVARVCRTGGHVILINPVSWPYHAAPVDCWRIYPEGMRALLEDTRLRPIECRHESLETPGYRRYLPGRSAAAQNAQLSAFYRLAGRVGFPVERAYDTITIAQKV
jgi:SAM-dependent methyltransferase